MCLLTTWVRPSHGLGYVTQYNECMFPGGGDGTESLCLAIGARAADALLRLFLKSVTRRSCTSLPPCPYSPLPCAIAGVLFCTNYFLILPWPLTLLAAASRSLHDLLQHKNWFNYTRMGRPLFSTTIRQESFFYRRCKEG